MAKKRRNNWLRCVSGKTKYKSVKDMEEYLNAKLYLNSMTIVSEIEGLYGYRCKYCGFFHSSRRCEVGSFKLSISGASPTRH